VRLDVFMVDGSVVLRGAHVQGTCRAIAGAMPVPMSCRAGSRVSELT